MKRFLLFFFLIFLAFVKPSMAQENFSTSLNSVYNIYENDPTEIIWNFKIKNKTSDFIASSYKLFINYPDAFNITALDSEGEIPIDLKKEKNGIWVDLNFQKKAAGINKEKEFSLKFNSREIYKKIGNSWEINISKPNHSEAFQSNSAEVNLPDSFTSLSIIKPTPKETDSNKLIFSDLKSGIKIISGNERIYDLILTYHLYNQNLFERSIEIAIPSDNSYQEVYIQDINPKPDNVRIDADGNYLASFLLKPSQKLDITVNEKIRVSSKPNYLEIYNFDSNSLISEKKYWEVNNSVIKKLAKNKNVSEIYNLVLDSLKYTNQPNARRGAVDSLSKKGSGISADFVDSFIALARAEKIPTRKIQGFLFNSNTLRSDQDTIHVWTQYYDPKSDKWIQIDPSLSKATHLDYFKAMDLDHIAFVTNGVDSINPKPAGTYKTSDSKDISVQLSEQFGLPKSQVKIRTEFDKQYFGGLGISGKVYFKNLTGAKIPEQVFEVKSNSLSPNYQSLKIPTIAPFGEVAVNVNFNPLPFLTKEVDSLKITFGQNEISKNIQILPIYQNKKLTIILIGVISSVITITIFLITRRARHI